jgi:hypothetical protein
MLMAVAQLRGQVHCLLGYPGACGAWHDLFAMLLLQDQPFCIPKQKQQRWPCMHLFMLLMVPWWLWLCCLPSLPHTCPSHDHLPGVNPERLSVVQCVLA